MTKTLNHYNKRHKRRRNKTQRKDKKRHGGRRTYYDFRPGQVHYFDQTNLDMLDALMERERRKQNPLVIRHYRKTCPHCEDFEKPWSELELNLQDNPLYSAASLNEDATKHITKEYPDYPRVNGVPTVVVVDSNGVPIEHTGPNTLDAIEKFLNEHGLKIAIVPIEQEPEPEPEPEPEEEPEEEYAGANDDRMNDSADGLGAGLGAGAGLGVVAAEPENPSMLSNVKQTVTKIDDSIKGGLDTVSETFTKSIDFKNLFSSSDTPASEPAPASAPASEPAPASAPANEGAAAAADAFPPAPPAPAPVPVPAPVNDTAVDANGNAVQTKDPNATGAGAGAAPQLPSVGGKRGKKTRRRRGNNNHNNHNNHTNHTNHNKSKRRHTKRSKRHTK